jgi:hypothetical protein
MRRTRTVILHFSASEGENVATIGGKMNSMNRMRMQSSPRPASGRRVVAGKRTRPDEIKNYVRKLLKRGINRVGNLAFNRTISQEKFRNFHLQVCMCVCVLHRSMSLKSLANSDKSGRHYIH